MFSSKFRSEGQRLILRVIIACATAVSVFVAPAIAQATASSANNQAIPNSGSDQNDKADRVATAKRHAETRERSIREASELFKNKDYKRGEAALLKDNRHSSDSLQGQLESARKLVQMALTLRQQYDHKGAIAVAQRALEILDKAKGQSLAVAEAQQGAKAYELSGFIYEELLRDASAADEAYAEAQRIDSGSVNAKRGIDRLAEGKARTERLKAGSINGGSK